MRVADYLNRRVLWITGASSGIGRAVATEALTHGASVVLTARRSELLASIAATAPERCTVLPADLEDIAGLGGLVDAAWDAFDGLDGLVYAAGVSQRSLALETSDAVAERLLRINYRAPTTILTALARRLVAAGGGDIVVVSSLAAYVPTPLRSSYAASKGALGNFAEGLATEVAPQGVNVLHVVPGFVQTEISTAAFRGDGTAYGRRDRAQEGGMPADVCAKKLLRAMARRKPRLILALGVRGRLGLFLSRYAPALVRLLVKPGA